LVQATDADKKLFQLLDTIDKHLPGAIILLTSDHGEFLGEPYTGQFLSRQYENEPRFGHSGPNTPILNTVPLVLSGRRGFDISDHTEIKKIVLDVSHAPDISVTHVSESGTISSELNNQLRALGYLN
jgi:hypothetical protein